MGLAFAIGWIVSRALITIIFIIVFSFSLLLFPSYTDDYMNSKWYQKWMEKWDKYVGLFEDSLGKNIISDIHIIDDIMQHLLIGANYAINKLKNSTDKNGDSLECIASQKRDGALVRRASWCNSGG
jgi:hypothetical protein